MKVIKNLLHNLAYLCSNRLGESKVITINVPSIKVSDTTTAV